MAGSPSPLTTHVLNTGMGIPASNMALSFYREDPSTNAWSLIKTGYCHSHNITRSCGKISATHNLYVCCHRTFFVSTGLLMKMGVARDLSHHKCLHLGCIKSILRLLSTGRVWDRQAFTHT